VSARLALAGTYARATTLELLRYPSFSVPALAFPATLFLVFSRASSAAPAARLAGFAAIAVLGVVFFQFGVGIAAERVSTWELYLRVLPVPARARVAGRICSALVFATAAATVVGVVAVGTTTVALAPWRWLALAGALLGGAVPFGLLGISLGYLLRPRAALPVANLLYLPLSYAGGLWGGPSSAPGGTSRALDLVPTHAWAATLWGAVGVAGVDAVALVSVAAWSVALAAVAAWAYARDEGERFS
jgi:ABC-2 type transport system permease protein